MNSRILWLAAAATLAGFLMVDNAASAVPFTEALIADMEARGFQVNEGYPKVYGLEECIDQTYPAFKNCFQANPAAPYVIPVVKSWPDEYVDPATVNAFVVTNPGYSATYRLNPRDAIVIYGRMPPAGRYMGLQTWQFSQHGSWKPKDYHQWASTPDIPRRSFFCEP